MTKSDGLGANLYVSGYDISGDTQMVGSVRGGFETTPRTTIDKFAVSRFKARVDGELNLTTFFDDANDASHETFSSLPTADRILTYVVKAADLGSAAYSMIGKQINYDFDRGQDGNLVAQVQALPNTYGPEWGKMLTAGKRTDTGATNGTGVDVTGNDFGLQAWLHVFSFTGTDATVVIQESSDAGVGDAYGTITGGSFTEVSSLLGGGDQASERIQTARDQTIEQYLRVATTTSGGFSELIFTVAVKVNKVSVVYN